MKIIGGFLDVIKAGLQQGQGSVERVAGCIIDVIVEYSSTKYKPWETVLEMDNISVRRPLHAHWQ